MIKTHLKKYNKNYLFILFVIGSFVLSTIYEKKGINIYYVIALVVFILGFTNFSFIKELGLSFKILNDKKTVIFIIPVIVISNFLLVYIKQNYMDEETQLYSASEYKLIFIFLFINCIRIFGEEFIFRGFLLIKSLTHDKKLFWLLNIAQALLFSFIHTTFVDNLDSKIVFGTYVFVLSVYFGWLNRKFSSILPSFIIHWMNGIQTLVLVYI